ncbi:trimeric intracellular cation channel family protein [Sphingomonas cavernae]|uniref:Trimeric intracellular cation channel family protein n=1 Tax=Sphingomonas cavernae TaxID=2320861 RepID=A0A418WK76_9SPHN|nr:trimeric intracellular cation channel family protein [Sphingomonas cavernae]RJF90441.1 trimeric intracellular cation channel family protein [Sphingomonas cavernae]
MLDLLGIAVFAASGALAAANKQQTIVTFAFFALVTGVGGGTVRDLLIGAPVFWVHDWRYPAACLATALLIWVTPKHIWRPKALDWFDAVGLAAYAVFGAAKSLSFGISPLPAIMMGVITACVGGIIREILAHEPSILLRPELYVTAAALTAALFVGLVVAGIAYPVAAVVAAVAGFMLRGLAIWKQLALPAYRG